MAACWLAGELHSSNALYHAQPLFFSSSGVMSFACQRNSYATSLATRVLSCKPARFDAVLRVLRNAPQAVHFTSQPLEEGSEVHVEVDWRRQFDHMQQHSG